MLQFKFDINKQHIINTHGQTCLHRFADAVTNNTTEPLEPVHLPDGATVSIWCGRLHIQLGATGHSLIRVQLLLPLTGDAIKGGHPSLDDRRGSHVGGGAHGRRGAVEALRRQRRCGGVALIGHRRIKKEPRRRPSLPGRSREHGERLGLVMRDAVGEAVCRAGATEPRGWGVQRRVVGADSGTACSQLVDRHLSQCVFGQ